LMTDQRDQIQMAIQRMLPAHKRVVIVGHLVAIEAGDYVGR
jgi:hypothetical protein